jgi:Biotin-requiring enzyme
MTLCRRPLLRLARFALVRQQQQQQRARMVFSPPRSSCCWFSSSSASFYTDGNKNRTNNNDNNDSFSRRTAAVGRCTTGHHRGRGPDDDDDDDDAGDEDGNSRRTSTSSKQEEVTRTAHQNNDHNDHDYADEDDSTIRLMEGIPVEEVHSPLSRQQVNEQYADHLVDRSMFRHVIEITMPDLGDDVGPATVLQWHKQVGDIIEHGALLCEIETAQFSFTMEIDDDELGLLDEIYVPAGTSGISTGQRLAKILHRPVVDDETY